MIAASTASRQPPATTTARSFTWQQSLAQAITDPAELLAILQLDPALQSAANEAAKSFPLRVPRGFVARMSKGNPSDPLLLQVLPLHAELLTAPDFVADPVGDLQSRAAPNVLHKYQGRALLVTTGACAVHCRYCFRRHYPYAQDHLRGDDWQQSLSYLQSHTDISEVILSGGDPLSLSDQRLKEISDSLVKIKHLKRLRIHTRQPIVLPERVDDSFCAWLESIPLQKVVVVHCNHAQEIDNHVRRACERMNNAGALLLNQSVLLAGVNDSVNALADLSESLMSCRVLPYYLHLLDRVLGAAHFDVPEQRAKQLLLELSAKLPGFLVPKIVREVAGASGKTPLAELLALDMVTD
jgi:EF-P beta-lysylation protein EpmB